MSISPWNCATVSLPSPDGRFVATVVDPSEIAMGGPTSGLLRFSSGFEVDNCSPSMVWSTDSKYLAVPQWTVERSQRLLIVNPAERSVVADRGSHVVLQLDEFENGVVAGVDSPIHRRLPIRIKIAHLLIRD